ncbi:hypothetical protein EZV62_023183 [Acer yangbiense]|uniref:Uncharacterized protein n=1 Tax=Acer yangbiense TaxID=1000413 RepID=A0A5C7H1K4_9ROSI|nr:hypothetical protein EZV62_023183 [Acer yangbiense]
MAYRRSLSKRATLIARAFNNPSFSYIPCDHHDRDNRDSTLSRREVHNFIQQRSSFGRVSQFSLGSAFVRYMSTSVGEGGGSDNKIELIMSDVADVVSDATTTQVNEVAIAAAAAADSSWPVTVLQHFIDSVHNFTGLNWWASIVTFKHFKEMLEDKDMDPEALADGQKQMQKAHEECWISVLIDGLSFSISAEVTMQEFMKVDRDDDFMKIISRCVAVLLVSATMDCPKVILPFSLRCEGIGTQRNTIIGYSISHLSCYMLLFDYIKPGPIRLCTSYIARIVRGSVLFVAMAYRRSLSTRETLVARAYNPSFSYILRDHDRKEDSPDRQTGKGVSQFSLGSSAGSAFCRYMSTTVGEGSDKIELMSDVADVLIDATTQVVANHAPAVNEVAIAAADSFLPVAALQHVIDAVYNFTGLN